MIKVGIIGGAGYTAGELLRILVNHPEVEIVFVHSTSNAGNFLYDVHGGLFGDTQLRFSDSYDLSAVDVLFLCSAHGKSREFWERNALPAGLKVVDLAQDYRDESDGYVYGLPEWQRDRIRTARKVANPGCFATAIQLALLPLAANGLLAAPVHVTAVTGSTGAGVKPSATTHFSWRTDNLSTYKVFEHQHLKEICRTLGLLQPSFGAACPADVCHPERSEESSPVRFVPMRGDFARGIFASVTVDAPLDAVQALDLYQNYYADAAFTFVSDRPVDLKQVVNTNKAIVAPEVHGGTLVVSSVIDNLLKGASGQAVQNMNLIFGIPETTGLKLKASAF
jgi:N-acetyl-gamma-glutamyl-phosphate reductase (EC 1.2.1.38)